MTAWVWPPIKQWCAANESVLAAGSCASYLYQIVQASSRAPPSDLCIIFSVMIIIYKMLFSVDCKLSLMFDFWQNKRPFKVRYMCWSLYPGDTFPTGNLNVFCWIEYSLITLTTLHYPCGKSNNLKKNVIMPYPVNSKCYSYFYHNETCEYNQNK